MRLTALAGMFLCVAIFAANSPEAHAEIDSQKLALGEIKVADALDEQMGLNDMPEPSKPKVSPVEYVVKEGDKLTLIAEKHNTTWQRIFAKNSNIADPNMINVGEKLIIPDASEQLSERQTAASVVEPAAPLKKKSRSVASSQPSARVSARGSSTGNTYTAGYCTYYAKQRRPDLPNNLGNASTWVSRARAQGIPTGTTPRAGAIGQSGNHVVYVERVNGDGTITISDMNWGGRWKISTRVVPANSHTYIY
ncbi:LysM peptidoglycan-binding domain-containing protein [Candidatus Saccharibacteria bacterium]|nr:LysM peptidoglycan-binding domain-containing protein [Candidatus Saccharibacteria bacterium]